MLVMTSDRLNFSRGQEKFLLGLLAILEIKTILVNFYSKLDLDIIMSRWICLGIYET